MYVAAFKNVSLSLEEEHSLQMFWKRTLMGSILAWTKEGVVEIMLSKVINVNEQRNILHEIKKNGRLTGLVTSYVETAF